MSQLSEESDAEKDFIKMMLVLGAGRESRMRMYRFSITSYRDEIIYRGTRLHRLDDNKHTNTNVIVLL